MKYEGHTEGPWNNQEFALSNEICTRGNPLIAVVQSRHCHSPEELRANARLIAAAPDLLADRDRLRELLKESLRCLRDAKHQWAPSTTNSDADTTIARIAAALKEAEG